MSRRRIPLARARAAAAGLACALPLAAPGVAAAGAYVFASETNGVDIITHPPGYTGTGGSLSVSFCIDPASDHAAEMVIGVQNAVRTWSRREPTVGNLRSGAANDVPAGLFDFESVVLHEMGHALGLAHPNLGVTTGVGASERDYTQSTDGSDGFDLDDGSDDVIGSADDLRGDDVNLHWFRIANNHPFTLAPSVDASSYSRDLADLPGGDSFAANADRDVGAALGFVDSEAVMQQGIPSDEAQRTLGHDDVAGLRLGMAGVDETADTSDDYDLEVVYAGLTTTCDVPIAFDDAETGFAVCDCPGAFVAADHAAIDGAAIFLSDATFDFYFNDVPNVKVPALARVLRLATAGALVVTGVLGLAARRRAPGARR